MNIEREFSLYFGVTRCSAKLLLQGYLNFKKDDAKLKPSKRIELRKAGSKKLILRISRQFMKLFWRWGLLRPQSPQFLIMMPPI